MGKIIKLTESDLIKLVNKVLREQVEDTAENWEEVKDYLVKNGFPPNYPNKGVFREDEGHQKVNLWNDKFSLQFSSTGYVMLSQNDTGRRLKRYWFWDGQKPKIKGLSMDPIATKNAKGMATTEQEILSGEKILKVGSRGDLVKKLQWRLNKIYPKTSGCKKDAKGPQDCDGIYGELTKKNIKDIQDFENFDNRDGSVGRETWVHLFSYTK